MVCTNTLPCGRGGLCARGPRGSMGGDYVHGMEFHGGGALPVDALSIAGSCPEWLTWLRYTIFIPTYPFGVVAEMLLLYHALPYARERDMYNLHMPNWYNFAFDWHNFMVGGLCYYPFAWLQLYTHMFAQRKKKLTTQLKTD
eukprot:CAMPEP_0114321740 /NCGR_PEP_ID=MMETSP0059-20121206/26784_1 /TAXON_ID=36894 /ORGANISM="Pyramimonas parkeae, Strain CCMP726" /LENGTH=141 /DNA_ID=CAMNT_0001449531 /DNA_START=397 /DNA_END=823 /DNA_ORIENTATION=-